MKNREIKFRAWDIREKKFAFPSIVGNIIYENHVNKNTDVNEHFILDQYTEQKDNDGKEIYERDILSEKWRVEVYKNIEGTYMVKFHTNPNVNQPQSLYRYLKRRRLAGTAERDCIIIGNIYENENLLTK